MNLLSNSEVNTGRQFEFDLAKAVCIFGMVFVHCFEQFPLTAEVYSGSLYYTFVTVLDALFGAGTFMICLGVGLAYTKNNKPENFIKRGISTFIIGYLLNVFRFVIPCSYYFFILDALETAIYLGESMLFTDIMQFAGLAFILFGLLKKHNISDWVMVIFALVMSVIGSFLRFIDFGSIWINEVLGLFVATKDPSITFPYYAPFAFLNWFIFVVFGYLFGKVIRRCNNTEKFYAITTPVSAAIVFLYMAIAIPSKSGMMCGDETYYFQMTTLDAFIIMMGAVFIFGVYHFISKLFSDKWKTFITNLSVNINKTYLAHWVLTGWTSVILWEIFADGLKTNVVLLISLIIYIISSVSAELFKKKSDF